MAHVMLDLEAMSLSRDAAIVSIGAVRFNIETGEILDEFYKKVSLVSSQRQGGYVSGDTIMWWLQQAPEAQIELLIDPVLIDVALKEFSIWMREAPLEGFWGNGADYDNIVLLNAYLRQGWTPPWTYRENRCYRTMAALFPNIKKEDYASVDMIEHKAIDDAKWQMRHLCAIWKELHERK